MDVKNIGKVLTALIMLSVVLNLVLADVVVATLTIVDPQNKTEEVKVPVITGHAVRNSPGEKESFSIFSLFEVIASRLAGLLRL